MPVRDTRELRKIIATILGAGIGAVIAQRLIEPKVKAALKVKR